MSKWDSRDGILARHAGHRCTIVDARSLRCLDCSHTLLLDAGQETVEATPTPAETAAPAVDAYGRMRCYRCSKLVRHLAADGLLEPVPHAVKDDPTGRVCTSTTEPPAQLPAGGWRQLVKDLVR